jgi:oxygen-independent coproporphyrinogen-3 oxidase
VSGKEDLSDEQEEMEIISLGLRTNEGFDMANIKHRKGIDKTISLLENQGYVEINNNRVVPTKKGFLVADRLPLYFLNITVL